jgi:hypothetical protein
VVSCRTAYRRVVIRPPFGNIPGFCTPLGTFVYHDRMPASEIPGKCCGAVLPLARVHAKTLALRRHLVGAELGRLGALGLVPRPQLFEPMPGNARVVRRALGISVSEVVLHHSPICALLGEVVAAECRSMWGPIFPSFPFRTLVG